MESGCRHFSLPRQTTLGMGNFLDTGSSTPASSSDSSDVDRLLPAPAMAMIKSRLCSPDLIQSVLVPSLGSKLRDMYQHTDTVEKEKVEGTNVNRNRLDNTIGGALRMRNYSAATNILWEASGTDMKSFWLLIIEFTYTSTLDLDFTEQSTIASVNAIVDSIIVHMKDTVRGLPCEKTMMHTWMMDTASCGNNAALVALQRIVLPTTSTTSPLSSLAFKPLTFQEGVSSCIVSSPCLLFPLSLCGEGLQGTAVKLYATNIDGRSFERVAEQILGYDGPTLILIKTERNEVLGMYANSQWKDSNRGTGSRSNFLFSLEPRLHICRARPGRPAPAPAPAAAPAAAAGPRGRGGAGGAGGAGGGGAYEPPLQWFNLRGYGLPHGLGAGGGGPISSGSKGSDFRLFVSDSLEGGVACSSCTTFEPGALLGTGSMGFQFKLAELEIWGVGGDEAWTKGLAGREMARGVRFEHIQRARKVDKAAFLESSFDREMLLGQTFAHQQQVQDREPTCL